MPIYDFGCPKCESVTSPILSYDEYDATEAIECTNCGTPLTKKDRIISGNIKAIVKGVRKGYYNSGDMS